MKTRPKLRQAFASWALYWLPEGVVCGAVVAALGFGLMALAAPVKRDPLIEALRSALVLAR